MVRSLTWLSGLALALCGASAVFGATITVTTCADNESNGCGTGECTLREAIGEAAAGDVVDFASPLADCGDGEIDLGSPGLTIAVDLTIEGPGAEVLAVDGNVRRVFDVSAGATVVIEDLTVKGGGTSSASQHGAGFRNAGDLTLRNVIVTGNQAFGSFDLPANGAHGGGIYNAPSAFLRLEECEIRQNAAGEGGIFDGSTNRTPGRGGGIYSVGDLEVLRSTISANSAGRSNDPFRQGGHGGGLFLSDGAVLVADSTIEGNRSGDGKDNILPGGQDSVDGFGAGVYAAGSAVLVLVNSTVSGNATGSGAGSEGLPGDGGGLYLTGTSAASLGNVTITTNHADRDGGGMRRASSAAVTLGNSVLAGNTAGTPTSRDCSGLGDGSSAGYNVIGVDDACLSAFGETDQTGSSGSPLDAMLDPLADNGGPTETHLPQAGSPVLDAGDPNGCTYLDILGDVVPVLADQRLISRPLDGDYDGDAVCDSGSVEVVPEDFTVSVTLDGSGSVVSDPAGIDCDPTCVGDFAGGTALQLTATADPGHVFTGWSGSCSGAENPCLLTVDEPELVTATFAVGHALTVVVDGSGVGSVTGPGIDCPGDCVESVADGAEVTLLATEEPGSVFTGWSGACSGTGDCHLTVIGDVSVTATFTDLVTVSVTKDGTGSGTVNSLDGGIDCGLDCEEEYLSGTAVELTAAADSGSVFSGWSGGCSGTGVCSLTPVADVSVTATFLPLAIFADGFESGTFDAWSAWVP